MNSKSIVLNFILTLQRKALATNARKLLYCFMYSKQAHDIASPPFAQKLLFKISCFNHMLQNGLNCLSQGPVQHYLYLLLNKKIYLYMQLILCKILSLGSNLEVPNVFAVISFLKADQSSGFFCSHSFLCCSNCFLTIVTWENSAIFEEASFFLFPPEKICKCKKPFLNNLLSALIYYCEAIICFKRFKKKTTN